MRRSTTLILILLVIALVVVPLLIVTKPEPGPDGQGAEIFAGADAQAEQVITKIDPSYRPWAKPLLEPPSGEIESLLFALQAALGASFIGYYIGRSVTRARLRSEAVKGAEC
jgi:cobalt/nickel transport protein